MDSRQESGRQLQAHNKATLAHVRNIQSVIHAAWYAELQDASEQVKAIKHLTSTWVVRAQAAEHVFMNLMCGTSQMCRCRGLEGTAWEHLLADAIRKLLTGNKS